MALLQSPVLWVAVTLAITLVIANTMGLFGANRMPVDGKTVLITGGSEGMGLAVATQLSAKGANLILVSRSAAKLEDAMKAVKAAAKNPSTQRFHYIPADVSVPSYADTVVAAATAWNGDRAPDVVWCIAGVAVPKLFIETDAAALRRQMDINFHGTADMAHAILRAWLAPGPDTTSSPKHLVMTSSAAALYTIPGYAGYAPSKWALRGLADTLSQEVLLYPGRDVRVHVVFPGTILSPGFVAEERTKPEVTRQLEAADPKQTPEEVARAAIRGLEAGQFMVVVNWLGHLMRFGVIGGSLRNSWLLDTLGAWLVPLIWIFVQHDQLSTVRNFGKKHGHPSTYAKTQE
ncbi:3-ketodihydrosphingosine reductase [Cordyceps fumosorosea ARSEF 2679]|uniref:3-dehydrosphinganine reductase n=1 Tax=Cordyceps fumosorosea (strain ARSEF 2679) TaxID=1081104 RepID=A0A162LQ25_CORFA|nr:3-ketodihydrosphingosine reductase [Cordyceps fumosorosea ARSEF 2679]OAA73974.1 3-ketodihydrosphingosine reductase [Cordyceps fumosorosea ARSEF 2679]